MGRLPKSSTVRTTLALLFNLHAIASCSNRPKWVTSKTRQRRELGHNFISIDTSKLVDLASVGRSAYAAVSCTGVLQHDSPSRDAGSRQIVFCTTRVRILVYFRIGGLWRSRHVKMTSRFWGAVKRFHQSPLNEP